MTCKKHLFVVVLGALLLPGASVSAQEKAASPAPAPAAAEGPAAVAPAGNIENLRHRMETLDSETNRVSYAIGVNVARNILHNFPDLNLDFFNLAVYDVFQGGNRSKLSEDQLNASIARYSEVANERARMRVQDLQKYNLDAAEKFLEQNGKNEGVITTTSGLQYKVINPGSNAKVRAAGGARVHLHTTLLNGHIFDSTLIEKSEAREMTVAEQIPALREALPLMTVGSKWELFIHPKLAYGAEGGKGIGPNELLMMQLEIVAAD